MILYWKKLKPVAALIENYFLYQHHWYIRTACMSLSVVGQQQNLSC